MCERHFGSRCRRYGKVVKGKLRSFALVRDGACQLVGTGRRYDQCVQECRESAAFFNNCYGYAVFPRIDKGGLGLLPCTATAELTEFSAGVRPWRSGQGRRIPRGPPVHPRVPAVAAGRSEQARLSDD